MCICRHSVVVRTAGTACIRTRNRIRYLRTVHPFFLSNNTLESAMETLKTSCAYDLQLSVSASNLLFTESVGTRVSGARCQSSAASNILTATVTSQIRERKKKYINSLYQYLNKLSFNLSFHIHLDACLSENYFVAFQCQMAKFDAKYDTS